MRDGGLICLAEACSKSTRSPVSVMTVVRGFFEAFRAVLKSRACQISLTRSLEFKFRLCVSSMCKGPGVLLINQAS